MGGEVVLLSSQTDAHRAPAYGSAVDGLVRRIRDHIDAHALGVGDSLPSERELCVMFASSRTTVREAMRMLKTYGVVDVRPKIGAVLIDRRIDTVFDLYSFGTLELDRHSFLDTQGLRQLLEVGGFDTLVAHATTDDIEALHALNESMLTTDTPTSAALQDYAFHVRLVAILGNRQIDEIYRIMKPIILKIMENRLLHGHSPAPIYHEHLGVLEALAEGDRLAFQYRMTTHLEAGLALIRSSEREGED